MHTPPDRMPGLVSSSKCYQWLTSKFTREEAAELSKRKPIDPVEKPTSLPPAMTVEGRMNQLVNAAFDLAERRILEGTASSQELTYFLKAGSPQTQLELEKLREENKLLRAKTEALQAQVSNEALLDKALKAFRSYRGEDEGEEEVYDEDVY